MADSFSFHRKLTNKITGRDRACDGARSRINQSAFSGASSLPGAKHIDSVPAPVGRFPNCEHVIDMASVLAFS